MSTWGGRSRGFDNGPARRQMHAFGNGRILVSPVSAGAVTPDEQVFLRGRRSRVGVRRGGPGEPHSRHGLGPAKGGVIKVRGWDQMMDV
jgi:hypothetical protein